MKLIIQIPCLNEEDTLPATLNDLPEQVPGFDTVEVLVIDDGSDDRTAQVARDHGADHVLQLKQNQGLARAFSRGLDRALELGADVIVNTDGDNQYSAGDIPALTAPILDNEADMVVGSRPIEEIDHFSFTKKCLQRLGSWFVRRLSGTSVEDATSGFRAFSRETAMNLNVFDNYTYTLETLILAGQHQMTVESVPVEVNEKARPSRLISSLFQYLRVSGMTLLRTFMTYHPLRFFGSLGLTSFFVGVLIGLRFLYFYFTVGGEGHIQSLILCSVLLVSGVQLVIFGLVAELISVNRQLVEDVQYRIQRDNSHRSN